MRKATGKEKSKYFANILSVYTLAINLSNIVKLLFSSCFLIIGTETANIRSTKLDGITAHGGNND